MPAMHNYTTGERFSYHPPHLGHRQLGWPWFARLKLVRHTRVRNSSLLSFPRMYIRTKIASLVWIWPLKFNRSHYKTWDLLGYLIELTRELIVEPAHIPIQFIVRSDPCPCLAINASGWQILFKSWPLLLWNSEACDLCNRGGWKAQMRVS